MKSLIWTKAMESRGHMEKKQLNKRLEVIWDDVLAKGAEGPNLTEHPTDEQVALLSLSLCLIEFILIVSHTREDKAY